jgi:hypothetical protein
MKILNSICSAALIIGTIFMGNAAEYDWGKTGHRTVGKIAEGYLKGKTKRKLAELLNGQSLALIATFGDDIKSDRRYDKFYTWHYINMPFDVKYEESEKNSKGDLVSGIAICKKFIQDKNTSKEERIFYLKLLVHLIGDLHQPMHVGRAEDKGGNTIQVQWFNNGSNLHAVWDSKMINHYNMTYSELAKNSDKISKEQVKNLQKGTISDWANETHQLAIKVYSSAEIGENLRYEYMYKNFGLVRSQLQKGGIRLAKVLNELFR